jgi:hypothetical protein
VSQGDKEFLGWLSLIPFPPPFLPARFDPEPHFLRRITEQRISDFYYESSAPPPILLGKFY